MKKNNRITAFAAEFTRFIPAYNLGDWDISFAEKPLKNDEANLISDPSTRVARVTLSTNCKEPRLALVARHEAAHLFLSAFSTLASDRHTTAKQLSDEEERLCTVLEKWELK